MPTQTIEIFRHKTAIKRRKFSKPVQLLLYDAILNEDVSFFDYGCGYGEDVAYLKKLMFKAKRWDPFFAKGEEIQTTAVVNLGIILNIIEDPDERAETLRKAYDLAEDLLVVSVMIRDQVDEIFG